MRRRAKLLSELRLLLAVAACLYALAPWSAHAQSPAVEYAIKATFLYKFAPFVAWPAAALAASDPFVICVVGTDPVADVIDEAAKGQAVAGHPVRVLHLHASARDAHCHILYVALRGAAAAGALDDVRGKPVLTVTNAARDPRTTGIVNFLVLDNRVRFEIDQAAAAENGLVVSSKLLNLAYRVTPKP